MGQPNYLKFAVIAFHGANLFKKSFDFAQAQKRGDWAEANRKRMEMLAAKKKFENLGE